MLRQSLASDWVRTGPSFAIRCESIRERGVAVASDIDKDLIGVAAPIFVAPDTIGAALVLARIKKEVDQAEIERLTKLAHAATRKISERLQALSPVAVA